MAVRILYIGYWGAHDGLTTSTIIPHINILCSFENVDAVIFCSIERSPASPITIHEKAKHVPLYSKNYKNVLLTKLSDFTSFPSTLRTICTEEKINLIICRSALAGIFGYDLSRKFNIPFVVESFEPHAEYMIEGGTWNRYGSRSVIQQWMEQKQKRAASFLLPVSSHYANRLIREGIPESKIITVPCCVSIQDFAFNSNDRLQKRNSLGIEDHEVVGIYVGKFGDIYYTTEAYDLYRYAFDFFKNKFRLIVLTGDDHDQLRSELMSRGIPPEKIWIEKVPHTEVPTFLSAADFAFSTIKPSPSRLYCSPIKNGEYWANGLPILTEMGIGEDSEIIMREGGGVILDRNDLMKSFNNLQHYLSEGRMKRANEIQKIALKHRSFDQVRNTYLRILPS